jgi:hypothetical protein
MTRIVSEQHVAGYAGFSDFETSRRHCLRPESRRWRHGDPAGSDIGPKLIQIKKKTSNYA